MSVDNTICEIITHMVTEALGPCQVSDIRYEALYSPDRYSPKDDLKLTIELRFNDTKGLNEAIQLWREGTKIPATILEPIVTEVKSEPVVKRIVGDEGSW